MTPMTRLPNTAEELSKIAFWTRSSGATKSRTGGVGTLKTALFQGEEARALYDKGKSWPILDSS
jgi:hypothetical protein